MSDASLGLEVVSKVSLLVAFVLIVLIFWIAYSIWSGLFYILLFILIVATIYRLAKKINGVEITESENPKVFTLARSVAAATGTKAPDKIIVTPLTGIGVTGIFDRKLLLGCGALSALSTTDLYAILFHEFAHFKGADNILGSTLMSTTYSFRDIAAASRYIPTIFGLLICLFLLAFFYAYAAATFFYSRQREYLADWIGASFVGGEVAGNALQRYVRFVNDFNLKIGLVINHYSSQGLKLTNMYDAYRKVKVTVGPEDLKRIEEREKRMYEKSSWLSTHPATKSRIDKIHSVNGSIKKLPAGQASDLFGDFRKLETESTNLIYKTAVITGRPVVMPTPAPQSPAERIGKVKIKRESGYLVYVAKDGYVWRVPTKDNINGKKERIGIEKFDMDSHYLYFVDNEGYVSRTKKP